MPFFRIASSSLACIWLTCASEISGITRDWTWSSRLDFICSWAITPRAKTNILEAIYLLATLRSFRGVGGAQIIRHAQKGYFIGSRVVGQESHEIRVYWSAQERRLSLDGQPVRKLTDYLGTVRAVVFCTEDLQLVKGPASRRRRFLDLLLAQTHSSYLPLLQRYALVLRSRNALLKLRPIDEASVESFTHELISLGVQIMQRRQELTPQLVPLVCGAYGRIAHQAEELSLAYHPSVRADFAVELAQSRARERTYRTTLVGPHRDELQLTLNGKPAAAFASEGQKRTLAIALKMAQAEYVSGLNGVPPILLIDDVMGELDARRRSGLLPLLDRSRQASGQVFMTCTEEKLAARTGP